jgi:tetratricopeptide (TPR) repeat protein
MNKQILILTLALLFPIFSLGQSKEELLNKAIACAKQSDYQCAEKNLKELIELEENDKRLAVYYSNPGTFQRRQDKKAEALESYNKAISIRPDLIFGYTNRATLKSQLGDNDGALEDYEKVLQLDPKNEKALVNRAYLYEKKLDRRDLAIKDLELLIKHDPDNYKAKSNLANIKKRQGKYDEALSD